MSKQRQDRMAVVLGFLVAVTVALSMCSAPELGHDPWEGVTHGG